MSKMYVYSGTYQATNWSSDIKEMVVLHTQPGIGIACSAFDPETGSFELLRYTPFENNPSVICISPDKKYLYVGNETKNLHGEMGAGGGVAAFSINPENGELAFINQVLACGTFPCGIVTDSTGKYVIVSNHASYFTTTSFEKTADGDYEPRVHRDVGSLTLFKVRADGGLEECCDVAELQSSGHDKINQGSPHPHGLDITPDDFVIAPNKGGDAVELFKLDRENDCLQRLHVCPAEYNSAPRHLALHPTKPYVFVVNEFNNKTVSYYLDKAAGQLKELQRIYNVPPTYVAKAYAAGDIHITPDGKFIYCTAMSYSSIVCYRFDEEAETMSLVGAFRENMTYFREFNITPDGNYLIAGDTPMCQLVAYRIDRDTGHLHAINKFEPAITPSCVRYVIFD